MKSVFTILACMFLWTINAQQIQSPSKDISVDFSLSDQGEPTYKVSYKGKEVIEPSKMGIALKNGIALNKNFNCRFRDVHF